MNTRPSFLAVLTVLAALPATSQQPSGPPLYHIELVLFRAATALGGAENWGAEAARAATGEEAASTSTQRAQFVAPLAESQYQLTSVANRLKSTGLYVPIAHVAWSQTASAWGKHPGLPLDKLGLNVQGLTGTVTLERGQFLHLGLTLAYAMPNPPAGLAAAPGTTFTINENRRVKFHELNYYDHPAFGVIALVTPERDARPPGR